MDCHTNIDEQISQRKTVIRGRVDKYKEPNHWVFGNVPWRMVQDVVGSAGFRRSRNVTWAEQIRLHGEGNVHPGSQYAFADKRFNQG